MNASDKRILAVSRIVRQEDFYEDTQAINTFETHLSELGYLSSRVAGRPRRSLPVRVFYSTRSYTR